MCPRTQRSMRASCEGGSRTNARIASPEMLLSKTGFRDQLWVSHVNSHRHLLRFGSLGKPSKRGESSMLTKRSTSHAAAIFVDSPPGKTIEWEGCGGGGGCVRRTHTAGRTRVLEERRLISRVVRRRCVRLKLPTPLRRNTSPSSLMRLELFMRQRGSHARYNEQFAIVTRLICI